MRKCPLAVCTAGVLILLCGCQNLSHLFGGELKEVMVERSPRWFEPNRIVIVDVQGFLSSSEGGLFSLGETTVADLKEKLNRAGADRSVKAVILRIDSPGGEVTASDVMCEEVRAFREESGKPVVACLMGVAASGGYYVALAADRIVASPTAVTGSVGVITRYTNIEGLYNKVGLRSVVIKSGAKKDMGSGTRTLTQEERQILEGINRSLFERFAKAVRVGRLQMTDEDFSAISDGRVVTADQALKLHMVDSIGYLEDALAQARSLAGIGGAHVIIYRPFPHYNANIYASMAGQHDVLGQMFKLLLERRGPTFLYLWSPGL